MEDTLVESPTGETVRLPMNRFEPAHRFLNAACERLKLTTIHHSLVENGSGKILDLTKTPHDHDLARGALLKVVDLRNDASAQTCSAVNLPAHRNVFSSFMAGAVPKRLITSASKAGSRLTASVTNKSQLMTFSTSKSRSHVRSTVNPASIEMSQATIEMSQATIEMSQETIEMSQSTVPIEFMSRFVPGDPAVDGVKQLSSSNVQPSTSPTLVESSSVAESQQMAPAVYECVLCAVYFATKVELRFHLEKSHLMSAPAVSECVLCSEYFATKNELRFHLEKSHLRSNNDFQCCICSLKFAREIVMAHSMDANTSRSIADQLSRDKPDGDLTQTKYLLLTVSSVNARRPVLFNIFESFTLRSAKSDIRKVFPECQLDLNVVVHMSDGVEMQLSEAMEARYLVAVLKGAKEVHIFWEIDLSGNKPNWVESVKCKLQNFEHFVLAKISAYLRKIFFWIFEHRTRKRSNPNNWKTEIFIQFKDKFSP